MKWLQILMISLVLLGCATPQERAKRQELLDKADEIVIATKDMVSGCQYLGEAWFESTSIWLTLSDCKRFCLVEAVKGGATHFIWTSTMITPIDQHKQHKYVSGMAYKCPK